MKYLICLCLLFAGCGSFNSNTRSASNEEILTKARRDIRLVQIDKFWERQEQVMTVATQKETGLRFNFIKSEVAFVDQDDVALMHVRVVVESKTIARLFMLLVLVDGEWEIRAIASKQELPKEE